VNDDANAKPWWQSKVIWFNVIALTLGYVESQMQVLKGMLPEWLYPWLVLLLPLGNIWLRAITNTAVTLRAPEPKA
jgi:hypothetical protein